MMLSLNETRQFEGPSLFSGNKGVFVRIVCDGAENPAGLVLGTTLGNPDAFEEIPVNVSMKPFPEALVEIVSFFVRGTKGGILQWKLLTSTEHEVQLFLETAFPDAAEHAVAHATKLLSAVSNGKRLSYADWTAEYERYFEQSGVGMNTQLVVRKAAERGIPSWPIGQRLVQFGYGKNKRLLWETVPENASIVSVDIALYRDTLNRFVEDLGYYVPHSLEVEGLDDARRAAVSLGYPVVVKSAAPTYGLGTFADIRSESELEIAFNECSKFSNGVIIQEMVQGRMYRITVVGDSVFAIEADPPTVTGDGITDIQHLIERENARPERGALDKEPLTRIEIDTDLLLTIARQGYALQDIPAAGKLIRLKSVSTSIAGAGGSNVTDALHPFNATLAIRLAKSFGLPAMELTVITDDISKPMVEGRGKVISVSPQLDLRTYLFPSKGRALDLLGTVIDYLYPEGSDPQIPIIAVAGSHGKTLVTSMVDYMMRLAGRHTGHACSTGVYLNGTKANSKIADNKSGHMMALVDGNVDCAILEIDALSTSVEGLAFLSAHTSAVLNCFESQEGIPELYERVIAARKLLVRHTRPDGYVVLNASTPEFKELANEASAETIVISSDPDHPFVREPSSERGIVGTTMGLMLVLKDGGKIIPLVNYLDAPLTFEGLADFNIENLLAAAAIAYANDVHVNVIRNGLLTFTNNPHQLPGAMNQFQVQGRYIFVDLATKVANLAIASRFVKRYSRRYSLGDVFGVLSFPDEVDAAVSNRVLSSIRAVFKRALVYGLHHPESVEQNDSVFGLADDLKSGIHKIWNMLRENDVLFVTSRDAHEALRLVRDLRNSGDGNVR